MDFKFLVLALVISAAAGEDTIAHKLASPAAVANKSLSLDTIKHSSDAFSTHEKIALEPVDNTGSITQNVKVVPLIETSPKAVTGTTTSKPTAGTPSTTTLNPPTTTTVTTAAVTDTTSTPTSITTSTPPTTTPKLIPEEGQWKVQNETGGVCIAVQMQLQFNVTYPGKNTTEPQNGTIFVPKAAISSGNCSSSNSSQSIQLTWGEGNSFKILFGLNKTSNKFEILLLNLTINVKNFTNVHENTSFMTYMNNKVEFPAVPIKMSYKCDKEQMQVLKTITNEYSAKMLVSHTQLEAFMSKKDGVFDEAEDCEGFETPDIVPIAVGCVLSILVVIVLIAYLIGRRRSQNRGYLSISERPISDDLYRILHAV